MNQEEVLDVPTASPLPARRAIHHEGMDLLFRRDGTDWRQYAFGPGYASAALSTTASAPAVILGLAGESPGFLEPMVSGYNDAGMQLVQEELAWGRRGLRIKYRHPRRSLAVELHWEFVPGVPAMRGTSRVTNEGHEDVTLTRVSSLYHVGFGITGELPWQDPAKIRIHYCRQAWRAEGQWRCISLPESGVFPSTVHPQAGAFRLSSVGSFSTARYLPMLIVEDVENRLVWYSQIEVSAGWQFELALRRGEEGNSDGLFLCADAASERAVGWAHRLKPGETFQTAPAMSGCCGGDMQDGIHQLTRYRRYCLRNLPGHNAPRPVVFNDYMNCLWGQPTREKLSPLIERASAVGAEVFCIDAGWHSPINEEMGVSFGLWEPSPDRFEPDGLLAVLTEIQSCGMTPGLWLEMELSAHDGTIGRHPDDWFLRRHGNRVRGGRRVFLNFANSAVRDHYEAVFDRLIAMGVGYFKIDYNDCTGAGDDTIGTTAADGLLVHIRGLYAFIARLRAKYPAVIWENCASGAMRSDYGILPFFHLQSSSDQEIYHEYPAIISGSLAAVLPEQLGVWAYPFPHRFEDRENAAAPYAQQALAAMEDGEETIFNMVNALCGVPCVSGRIDTADAFNLELIQEGVAFYKQIRASQTRRTPIWPLGFNPIHQDASWAALGLHAPNESSLLLMVWRRDSDDHKVVLELGRWVPANAVVKQAYPARQGEVTFSFNSARAEFTVCLPRRRMARCFSLSWETS